LTTKYAHPALLGQPLPEEHNIPTTPAENPEKSYTSPLSPSTTPCRRKISHTAPEILRTTTVDDDTFTHHRTGDPLPKKTFSPVCVCVCVCVHPALFRQPPLKEYYPNGELCQQTPGGRTNGRHIVPIAPYRREPGHPTLPRQPLDNTVYSPYTTRSTPSRGAQYSNNPRRELRKSYTSPLSTEYPTRTPEILRTTPVDDDTFTHHRTGDPLPKKIILANQCVCMCASVCGLHYSDNHRSRSTTPCRKSHGHLISCK
jgi:hypothetical protein